MDSTPVPTTPPPPSLSPPKRYRILLPLDLGAGYESELFHLALALAKANQGEILATHIVTPHQQEEVALWQMPRADEQLLGKVPYQTMLYHAEDVAQGILELAHEQQCSLILLHWRGHPRAMRNKLGHILDPVIEDAPCDVALLKGDLPFEQREVPAQRILLATAGGPHALGAARLALALAELCRGQVTLVTIIPPDAEAEREEASHALLADLMAEAGADERANVRVTTHVIRAPDVEAALVSASHNHDMVFLGATNDTVVNQLLMGSLVERVAAEIPLPVIIVKRYQGLTQFWLRRLWRTVDRMIPNLPAAEQLDTYKRFRRGARATTDFYVLILLSSIIAAMGLLLDSGAVIIGAMLVAPLMTPMMALGMGVVLGDTRLLGMAAWSTLKGVAVVIGISILVTLFILTISPQAIRFTPEIEARTNPTLLDLTVALAAGAAGAYSFSRKNVAAALPGVAIAAALVPPLCVVGISLGAQRWGAAQGSMLLFTTNLIAISFAATLMNLLFGFFPQQEDVERHTVLRRGLFAILAALFIVSVPLTGRFQQYVSELTTTATRRAVEGQVEEFLLNETTLSLLSIDWGRWRSEQQIAIYTLAPDRAAVSVETQHELTALIGQEMGPEARVVLFLIPTSQLLDESEVVPLPTPVPDGGE